MVPQIATVRYGANGTYVTIEDVDTGIVCDNSIFGDPIWGVVKYCEYQVQLQ